MEYRQQVYDFAEKYIDYFLDIRTTKEDLEEAGFGNACFNLGFGADGGRKFIVMCHDSNAFDDTDDLARVIDKVDNINVLGSAVSAKWDMAETLDEHTRMWISIALKRLKDMTEEKEPMTVQELSALLAEKRDEILEKTEVNTWDIDCWIHDPIQIVNMDSGIAYDVSREIGITIDDILDAVAREQMMSMMF